MYINKIENRIRLKIKTGYHPKLLTPETMKLLGSNKSKVSKNKNDENVLNLEITKVVSVHCYFVNNNYQQNSGVLRTFVPNKSFSQLLHISPKSFVFFRHLIQNFFYIEVFFTD